MTEPLHCLIDKKAPWVCGYYQYAVFQAIKYLLSCNSVLTHFNKSFPVVLICDTSPYGMGAILNYKLPDGPKVPITYYSCTQSSAERIYT